MKLALLNNGITMLHFDETYYWQKKLSRYARENIDFSHLKEVNLFCKRETCEKIKNRLSQRKHKGITYIGSGNYHYVTYLLLKEIRKPFSLVLFDNHTDLALENRKEVLFSCGSWVSYALGNIPQLQKVIIIGPTSVPTHQNNIPRVMIYPFNKKHRYSIKSILSSIQTKNIYISIDKDVLHPFEAETNWDQGIMDLETLTKLLRFFLKEKDVEGVDVCGEPNLSSNGFFLREFQRGMKKNEIANLKILQECLEASDSKTKGA